MSEEAAAVEQLVSPSEIAAAEEQSAGDTAVGAGLILTLTLTLTLAVSSWSINYNFLILTLAQRLSHMQPYGVRIDTNVRGNKE